MKEKTLVILAAGMGSRFGGIKQIEPVGSNGEIIADYSIYDSIRAGFTKVVFVIKKENYDYFKTHITAKYADKIKVEFAFQSLDDIPSDVKIPASRTKPLGTTHALLCAKSLVQEPFIMINADDFYGYEPYKIASRFIEESTDSYEYLTVNYEFCKANSKNGKVNRGIVNVKDDYVDFIDECSVETYPDKIIATSYETKISKEVPKNQPVSLSFFCFKPSIFALLEEDFNEFIHGEITDTNERILTNTIKKYIIDGTIKFKSELTSSKWLGVTYKDDLQELKESIVELVNNKEYPNNLWE